jgi:hypothetical protein
MYKERQAGPFRVLPSLEIEFEARVAVPEGPSRPVPFRVHPWERFYDPLLTLIEEYEALRDQVENLEAARQTLIEENEKLFSSLDRALVGKVK